jgi:tetratricopeptide (TPR) repeat protein
MPVVLLLLALAGLEAVLRLAGSGHPTSFFVRQQVGPKLMLVENGWFGLRFFPPALARSPPPVMMEADKPARTYRIFLFGESAAMGDPRPAFGVGRYLEALLRDRLPSTHFEVVPVAMTAINSHAILPIARECADCQGDLWIVYMGNNEFLGPFGASSVFGAQAPPSAWVRVFLAAERTRAGQWLVALGRNRGGSQSPSARWGGMGMFLGHEMPPTAPSKARIYANFRRNLEDIIRAGRRVGVPIILSTVACNLKDSAPFASVHDPPLAGSTLAEWERLNGAGTTNAQSGNVAGAILSFEAAARLSPNFAETYFRLGQCFLAATNTESARRRLVEARDLDALPFRADSRLNGLIAEAARSFAGKGVVFLDAEQALASSPAESIPGEDCFYDHVHLNFEGNFRLARALADRVLACLPTEGTVHQQGDWAGLRACERDLGLTDWNRCAAYEEMLRRLADPPFTQQLNHTRQREELGAQLAACRGRLGWVAAADARDAYEEVLRRRPEDHWLHHNYAEFLAGVRDLPAATGQMRIVCGLTPQHPAAYQQLGRLLGRQQKYDEAELWLERAVALRPDLVDLYAELGELCAAQGKAEGALKRYAQARSFHHDDARVCLLEAELWQQQNQRDRAIASLRDAIRLRPSYKEAHESLAMELGLAGALPEARAEFEQVVRLQPDAPQAHLNLGILLARMGEFGRAREEFEATLRLEPQNAKARECIARIEQSRAKPATP